MASAGEATSAGVTADGEPEAFWQAVRRLAFDAPAVREALGERREYALALRAMIQGEEAGEGALRRLCDAGDPEVRKESRRLYAGLLAAGSRWAELERAQRESKPGGSTDEVVTEYSKAPPATVSFPDAPVTPPTKLSQTGSPMVELTVNGHKRWFWVDTGAFLTSLSSDAAKATGVAPLGAVVKRYGTATTRTPEARPAVIGELALGGIRFQNHPAMILRAKDMRFKAFGLFTVMKIDGILGWNALSKLDLEIDYAQPRVVFRRPVRSEASSRNLFWLGAPLVRGTGPDGTVLHFVLDTGARRSWALPEVLRKTAAQVAGERTRSVGGVGGGERMKVRTVSDLEARVSDCTIRLSELRDEWRPERRVLVDGFVGVDLAGRGWMRLDPTNGRFECRPRPPADGAGAAATGG